MEDKIGLLSNYINENIVELPLKLNEKTSHNGVKYNYRPEYNILKEHIDNFIKGDDDERFIVLPGLRGIGKSTLLFQIYEYLLKERNIPYDQILYVSCDDVNDFTECHIRQITEIYLENHHDTNIRLLGKKIFLLVDESQYDKNWALSGKIIYDRSSNIFMIFTGSSALHLEYNANAARRSYSYNVLPVNFRQHIQLKYNINLNTNESLLKNMLFTGNIEECLLKEEEINTSIMNNLQFNHLEWNKYLLYGGFPVYFTQKDNRKIRDKIVEMTKKVVETDIPHIQNISEENRTNTNRILRQLALNESADISQNKLSNILDTATGNVKTSLELLEKTHLIFHLEAYGKSSNRNRKAWKYYFATSSIKYSLASYMGNISNDKTKIEGVLLENLVASKLYELSDENYEFSVFYDGGKKSNVDFIIYSDVYGSVPVEVGRGNKDKRQIINAMDHYNSELGIIISNKTRKIEKKDNIINIPPQTFALL